MVVVAPLLRWRKDRGRAVVQPGVPIERGDADLAEALRALPVPEHGSSFWPQLWARLDEERRDDR